MHTKTCTALAVILSAGLSAAALAQDATPDENGTDLGDRMTTTEAPAGTEVQTGIIASLHESAQSPADVVSRIAQVDASTDVSIVRLSELSGQATESDEAMSLDDALAAQAPVVAQVRTEIGNNPELASELEAEGFTADQVVAIDIDLANDRTVTLVVDDQA